MNSHQRRLARRKREREQVALALAYRDSWDYGANDEEPSCAECGSSQTWESCWDCGGGGFTDDLYKQDPLWYDPDDIETCETCRGDGGWWGCLNARNHPDAMQVNDNLSELDQC